VRAGASAGARALTSAPSPRSLYNTCPDPAISRRRAPVAPTGMLARVNKARAARAQGPLAVDPQCYESVATLEAWANQDAVKAALHVAPAITWAVCSNNNTFDYSPDIKDERTTIYPTLVAAGLQVLVYNGEADLCVPMTDNEWWTRSMGYATVKDWKAWSYEGDQGPTIGGYVIQYDKNFTYATVRGAGHMGETLLRARGAQPRAPGACSRAPSLSPSPRDAPRGGAPPHD